MAQFSGTMDPGEFVVVRDVFDRVSQDTWFKQDITRLDWLGRFVLNAYQGGITDNEGLYKHCLAASSSIANQSSEIRLF